MTDIVVPTLGESVVEATVAKWLKQPGDAVKRDDVLLELETDKVAVEVSAPEDGVLSDIVAQEGDTVEIGALLARMGAPDAMARPAPAAAPRAVAAAPTAAVAPPRVAAPAQAAMAQATAQAAPQPGPSAQRVAAEGGLDLRVISGSGPGGRVTKGDAIAALAQRAAAPAPAPAAPAPARAVGPHEERVRVTRIRATIARRLKEAQNTAAMLTTFNEADMSAIQAARSKYKDGFERKHGVKLGFMSFFVKACVAALKEIPNVNAEIDGDDIIYKNYYDIGIAVGTDRGLVVPVVRECDRKSMAETEKEIGDLGVRARDGHLKLEDLQGATFTISNGGVYGSLMSTPILNAPQSGILGMHKIQERPVAINGQVVIRPMMYLALSYDHRLVDGKEAVTFLVRVKEGLEDPERMLLDL
jgi:2-oxoglutarate dehydrogenase E2 component (dihydrolipoamide succinyltransferase)